MTANPSITPPFDTLRLTGYDIASGARRRRDATRSMKWVRTVKAGGAWRGKPPAARPHARPVLVDETGGRFVVDSKPSGKTTLRPYTGRAAEGDAGGFVALAARAEGAPGKGTDVGASRPTIPDWLVELSQDPAALAASLADRAPDSDGPGGVPIDELLSGLAADGVSALTPALGSGLPGFLDGCVPTGDLLGGLMNMGVDQLLGMGLNQLGAMAMGGWSVDDEYSAGEHLAHMAAQQLMGSLQGAAQSSVMGLATGAASGAPAPGSSAGPLDSAVEYVSGKPRGGGIGIAHNTSPTDHGGVLTATAATTLAGGLTVARLGDRQACPLFTGSTPHVGGPVTTSNPTVLAEGIAVTGEDHVALCEGVGGQTLLTPTVPTVRIGVQGLPVAVSSNGTDKNGPSDSPDRPKQTEREQLEAKRDRLRDKLDGANSDAEEQWILGELDETNSRLDEIERKEWQQRREEIAAQLADPTTSDEDAQKLLDELEGGDRDYPGEDTPMPQDQPPAEVPYGPGHPVWEELSSGKLEKPHPLLDLAEWLMLPVRVVIIAARAIKTILKWIGTSILKGEYQRHKEWIWEQADRLQDWFREIGGGPRPAPSEFDRLPPEQIPPGHLEDPTSGTPLHPDAKKPGSTTWDQFGNPTQH